MKKIRFLKLKELKRDFSAQEILVSLNSIINWTKMEYARECYWINERAFEPDVEIPTQAVSIEEYQTEIGQKKHWNYYLNRSINRFESGELLYAITIQNFQPHSTPCILVCELGGKETFIMCDLPTVKECVEYEDVTDEYWEKYVNEINPSEIEEFTKTHTMQEVEDKYCAEEFRSEMWTL